MSMYTDPDHIRVEDPGKIEGKYGFPLSRCFLVVQKMLKKIADMKEHYQQVVLVM